MFKASMQYLVKSICWHF